jgi:hypothetical protein
LFSRHFRLETAASSSSIKMSFQETQGWRRKTRGQLQPEEKQTLLIIIQK